MSVTRRIAFGAAASWFSRGVTIFLGLVLLPVLFRNLPREELGVWLLLGQSWAALGILDLGFGVTLTRRIAFAKGRMSNNQNVTLTDDARQEIADLMLTGRRIYLLLAFASFAVSWSGGFFYLRKLQLGTVSFHAVWIAWSILCLSQALGVWANIWTCFLQGVGYIGWDAILGSMVSALTLLTQIVVVLMGGHLVSLAVVAATGAIIQRVLIMSFVRRRQPELFTIKGQWQSILLRSMVSPALRAWLTAVGIVLVYNTDSFFIAGLASTEKLPAYRAAYLSILNLHMLAGVFAGVSFPFIGQLWQSGDIEELHRLVKRNLRLGLSILMAGTACILALGERLFNVWLGPGNFIGYPILIVFALTFVLEQQSYIMSMSCRATEDEAFPLWSLSAGVLKLIFTFLLAHRIGLLGIALGTLLAQLITNYWYTAVRALQRLRMSAPEHLMHTLGPCVFIFAAAAGITWLVSRSLAAQPEVIQVVAGSVAAGMVLLAAFWLLVLEQEQRQRLMTKFVLR